MSLLMAEVSADDTLRMRRRSNRTPTTSVRKPMAPTPVVSAR